MSELISMMNIGNLVRLYTLEGAIHNTEFNRLSEDTKRELKEFSDFLKNSSNVNSGL